MGEHRHSAVGVLVIVIPLCLGACGTGGGGESEAITRAQWQRMPWDLTQPQVVDRLGKSPSAETEEKCRARSCSTDIVYEFEDVKATFTFTRPEDRGKGRLASKTWSLSSQANAISAREYRRAIRPDTTVRQAQARLGRAEERTDRLYRCDVRGHCRGYVSTPSRCLTYGWTSGEGDRVQICFDLRTGRLLNDSYLTPSPAIVIPVPAE